MSDAIETILSAGKPSPDGMSATIAALYQELSVHGDPADEHQLLSLLRLLYRIARRDLPLARLFEGHVDALQIVARYANADITAAAQRAAAEGHAFGVWNAAIPGEPLRIEDGRLVGGKSFASGAGILSLALAGADIGEGNRLVLIDLATSKPAIDRDWWRVIGMQRSETHAVRWNTARGFSLVGEPGDYAREPYFSAGALRFVACHAGGIAALFDHVRGHLTATDRAADPHQAGRLTALYLAAAGAAAMVRSTAASWGMPDHGEYVAAARVAVSQAADEALTVAQQAIGVSGMFIAHPASAALTDLMVYLRQPAPDAQRMRVGRATAAGILAPDL